MIFKNIDLRLFGIKTTGKIVDTELSSSLSDRDYKHAKRIHLSSVVEYTVNGKKMISKSHSSADNIDKGIGDEVEILYRESEPGYFELQLQLKENLVAGIACILIGGIFTTIIPLRLFTRIKSERKMPRRKRRPNIISRCKIIFWKILRLTTGEHYKTL
jgi:hypothetical protein